VFEWIRDGLTVMDRVEKGHVIDGIEIIRIKAASESRKHLQ